LGYFGLSLGFSCFLGLTFAAVVRMFGPAPGAKAATVSAGFIFSMIVFYALAAFIGLVLTVKRLHDLDMSGWHYLWIITLPIILFGFSFGLHSKDMTLIAIGTQIVIWFWVSFWPGSPGANQYGER
jgi:uncharacterized membrane protein YhaH (DUF805 family)